jgi:KUP system potassium uptake protein
LVIPVNIANFVANIHKIPHGGYFPLLVALLILSLTIIYTSGNRKLGQKLNYVKKEKFIQDYKTLYSQEPKIKGEAIFMLRDINLISPYIINTIFDLRIIYEKIIFLSIKNSSLPYGIKDNLLEINKETQIYLLEVEVGYLEVLNIQDILSKYNLKPVVIFYGQENIVTSSLSMKIYSFLRKVAPTIVDFYNFPISKTIGINTNITL